MEHPHCRTPSPYESFIAQPAAEAGRVPGIRRRRVETKDGEAATCAPERLNGVDVLSQIRDLLEARLPLVAKDDPARPYLAGALNALRAGLPSPRPPQPQLASQGPSRRSA